MFSVNHIGIPRRSNWSGCDLFHPALPPVASWNDCKRDSRLRIGKNPQFCYPFGLKAGIAMATRSVNLTDEQDAFVEEIVRSGKYRDASEAMRDAVRGLELRLKADDLKRELLRTQLKAGLDALDRGAFTDVADADLDAALDDLAAPAR
jgi:antitoxin ParD1/3/4